MEKLLLNKKDNIIIVSGNYEMKSLIQFIKNNYFNNILIVSSTKYPYIDGFADIIENLNILNPKKSISYLLNNYKYIKTIFIYDVLYKSQEMEFLLHLLTYFKHLKIYLFTYVYNIQKLKLFFPKYTHLILKQQKKIEIMYKPSQHLYFYQIMKKYIPNYSRIIIFLGTKHHCKQFYNYFNKIYNNCFILYKNINNYIQIQNIIYKTNRKFILFTDSFENNLSIPNLDLIIDSCYDNINYCDKYTLIKRCKLFNNYGKIIRFISKEFYNYLPFYHTKHYIWDKEYLLLCHYNINPLHIILPNENFTFYCNQNIIKNFKIRDYNSYFFIINNNINIDIYKLILWIKKKFRYLNKKISLLILSLAIINVHSKNYKFVNHSNYKINQFFYEEDELSMLISLFLTIYMGKNRSLFITEFDINIKTFEMVLKTFENILQFIYGDVCWQEYLILSQKKNFIINHIKYTLFSFSIYKSFISKFLYNYSNYPIKINIFNMYCFKTITEYLKYGHPHFLQINSHFHKITLYVYPNHLNSFHTYELKKTIQEFQDHFLIKKITRQKFEIVKKDILNFISFKPFNHGMMDTIHNWELLIQNWNQNRY
jgi:hypothetical protein